MTSSRQIHEGEGTRLLPDAVRRRLARRDTVARLRAVKREVRVLYFASSQVVPFIDKLRYDLGEELDIRLDMSASFIEGDIILDAPRIG